MVRSVVMAVFAQILIGKSFAIWILNSRLLKFSRNIVDVYNAMLANQQSYERGLDDLKLTCDAYIDKLKFPECAPCSEFAVNGWTAAARHR